jgi:hypothetical protein
VSSSRPRKTPARKPDPSIERSFAILSTSISVLTRRVEALEQAAADLSAVKPEKPRSLFSYLFGGL